MENIDNRRNKGVYRPDMIQLMIDAVKEAKVKHQKEGKHLFDFSGGQFTISKRNPH